MDSAHLLLAIELAETDPPLETKVTLVVNGLLISGFITSENEYLMHLANAKYLEGPQEKDQDLFDPTFIHLRDATYYQPRENPILQNSGGYFRLPLTAVIAFSFGYELRETG
ncbi:hypothetical protein [Nitrosospira sp. Nsp13]|uniref:hypothetical protein n=1 Tax=Nitrosospira sp. Nsp13 TaxID=1855332 RepID=UPI00088FCFD2|nr:hypothetical protein [Nitrosospira sp. Nsp13]SCX76880.1 hypothetical protein SAMN05216308_10171 [Nitrosospira sp. Nsp13]